MGQMEELPIDTVALQRWIIKEENDQGPVKEIEEEQLPFIR